MTRRREPFFVALESLRSRAEAGVYVPGAPVIILDEARRLSLSTTPVREALVWLCGYGLLERGPTGGFLAPRLDPAILRDRYNFRRQCLSLSLAEAAHSLLRGQGLDSHGLPHRGPAEHMLRAVKSTGNATMIDAYMRVSGQLSQTASAERRLFRDTDAEAKALVDAFEADAGRGLADALDAYHRRRIEAAPLLILEAEAERTEQRNDE